MSLSEMTPHCRLCAAIGIIQNHMLASDSNLKAEAIFGHMRMEAPQLELASKLLESLLEYLEDTE